jgi:hypothetical protein
MSGVTLIHAAAPLPSGERAWAYAVGAPYHVAHGLAVDAPAADKAGDFQQEMLTRDWGIDNRAELIAQLTNLGEEGHRRRYGLTLRYYATLWRPRIASLREELRAAIREGDENARDSVAALWRLDAVQANTGGIRSSPLLAFDSARAVMLARAGLMLGWLKEDEAWPYLIAVARDVQRTYSSWAQYGADFVLSRNVWAGSDAHDIFDAVVALLLSKPDSPWQHLAWDLPLVAVAPAPAASEELPVWSLEQ